MQCNNNNEIVNTTVCKNNNNNINRFSTLTGVECQILKLTPCIQIYEWKIFPCYTILTTYSINKNTLTTQEYKKKKLSQKLLQYILIILY